MTYLCDYAKISPIVLASKIETLVSGAMATYTDIDEYCFSIGVIADKGQSAQVANIVAPYLCI